MATKIISIINLKGGVGKTTLAIALAEFLRSAHGKRVLLIDLDPQTNATIGFISEGKWKKKNEAGETVSQLFKDALDDTNKFVIKEAIEKNVSKLSLEGMRGSLDLLPSSLDLIDLQDSILQITQQSLYGQNPVAVLRDAIQPIKALYDYIIVDCPPNLGAVTLNGILISDFFLIPTIPDYLSTYGIPQILNRIERFKSKMPECKIQPMGIVINGFRRGVNMHNDVIHEIDVKPEYPDVFEARIPLTVRAAETVDPNTNPTSLAQKYPTELGKALRNLVDEVIKRGQELSREAS